MSNIWTKPPWHIFSEKFQLSEKKNKGKSITILNWLNVQMRQNKVSLNASFARHSTSDWMRIVSPVTQIRSSLISSMVSHFPATCMNCTEDCMATTQHRVWIATFAENLPSPRQQGEATKFLNTAWLESVAGRLVTLDKSEHSILLLKAQLYIDYV